MIGTTGANVALSLLGSILRQSPSEPLTLRALGWATQPTYTEEIRTAVARLQGVAAGASSPPWEAFASSEHPEDSEDGVWSERDETHVCELMQNPGDAVYIGLMDPICGLFVAELLSSFLETDLDQEAGHESCPIGECQIASVVALARYINRERS